MLEGRNLVLYDLQFAGGGPIVRNRLWFYTAHRKAVTQEYSPFSVYNKFGYGFAYAPDLKRPGFTDFYFRDHSGRLTWQLSSEDKIGFFAAAQDDCQCHYWVQIGVETLDARAPTYSSRFSRYVTSSMCSNGRMLADSG